MLQWLTLVLLCAASLNGAQSDSEFFPMAVWYGGGKARAPMLERDPRLKKEAWRADLKQIKSLGFNTIRCWIDWASGEPAEKQYRFDTIEVLLELAEQEGLRVVIQVYMDAAPDWVGRKHPDSLFISASGEAMKPESAPGYCFDHPGVRKATLDFFTTLAERAQKSPAFLGWDLWSEPHVINWAMAPFLPNAEFCFCPNTLARFQEWLRKKYGTIDALNVAWYRRFTSWEQAEPGRLSTILSYTDYVDWRTFIQEKLGEDLHMRYQAVKKGAPGRIATSHAAVPSLFTSPLAGDGAPDDWIMAKQADYYGTSFYPKHSSPVGRDIPWRAALMDFAKSSNNGRGFWIGELQGGFGTIALRVSATVTPDDLRVWAWTALSRGTKGVNFYAWYPMSSGYESGGYGLIQLDGTITGRSRAAGEVARVIDKNQQLFLRARPPKAEVAIIYNPMVHFVGGRQRAFATAGAQGEVFGIERDSLLGTYRALFPSNVPLDFVHISEITADSLKPYKLVIFPYPLMMPARAAKELIGYVRAGGSLLTEARAGWNNERGWAAETIPGLGLHEVLGCRETAVHMTPDSRTELKWTGENLFGLNPNDRLPGRLYEETLEPAGPNAKVVAVHPDGSPAAILSSFGAGKSITVGTYLGVAYESQKNQNVRRFFEGLLDWAGVNRPVAVTGAEAEVRWLESGRDRVAIIFHHAEKTAEASIEMAMPPGDWNGLDLQSGQPVVISRSGARVRFGKRLGPSEVWVVRMTPK